MDRGKDFWRGFRKQNIAHTCGRCNFLIGFKLECDFFGSLDLALKDMIKKEFENLFGGYKSYLYAIILKKNRGEGKKKRRGGRKNKEKITSQE